MTLDEIVQKIYEERYVDPTREIEGYVRDVMIREIVQRALELAMLNNTPAEDIADDCARTRSTHLPRDLYEACARAFGTTRDEAKNRILAELYGERTSDDVP